MTSIVFVTDDIRRPPDVDDYVKPAFLNPCYGGISADLQRTWPNVSRNSVFQVNLVMMISKSHCNFTIFRPSATSVRTHTNKVTLTSDDYRFLKIEDYYTTII